MGTNALFIQPRTIHNGYYDAEFANGETMQEYIQLLVLQEIIGIKHLLTYIYAVIITDDDEIFFRKVSNMNQ